MFPFKCWTIAAVSVAIGIILALVLPWNIGPLGQESVGMSVIWAQEARSWDDPELNQCIESVLDEITAELDQAYPERAPHWVDEWGNLRNKNVIDAQQPDDWLTRWNGEKYFRICCGWERPSVDRIQARCGCSCEGPGILPPSVRPPQPPGAGVNRDVEPNDRFSKANPIDPDSAVSGTIDPVGDHDWFVFQVPGRSRVSVNITGVDPDMEVVFQVWNANKDLVLGWQGPPRPGADTDITFELPGAGAFYLAGPYYLEVAESFNDGTSSYTLQVTVTPAVDAGENNDIFMNAQPLQPGQEVQGSILPRGDHDWYRVEIPSQGEVEVAITYNPPELDMAFQVWNADKEVVCGWQGPPRLGADTLATCTVQEPGAYYLEVADSFNDASSPEAYHLVVTGP